MNRRCMLWAVLSVWIATVLSGQGVRDPNNARGFDPGKLYSFSDVDAVNTFNGNLMVRLPIGQTYHVGSSLSYQLRLTYNSKVWDYRFLEYEDPALNDQYHRLAVPERDSNAGLGWSLSLGRILLPRAATPKTDAEPWTYVASDGSQHVIGDPVVYENPTVVYTDDGSFLRVTHTASSHQLEFPDGQIHTFDANGNLTEIRDRFRNWIRVSYGTTAAGAPLWTITDGRTAENGTAVTHRTHTVEFENAPVDPKTYVDPEELEDNPNFLQRVSRVSLAAFPRQGETAATARAVYVFRYSDTTIARGTCGANLTGIRNTVNVAMLEEVELPDGTKYDMTHNMSDVRAACESGTIQKLLLPTMGSIEWKHGAYDLSAADCSVLPNPGDARGLWSYPQIGVMERKFNPGWGGQPLVWTYDPELIPGPVESTIRCGEHSIHNVAGPPRVFTNTLTTPSGQTVKHYFSAYAAERTSPTPEELALAPHYGLPYITSQSDGGYFLSSETAVAGQVVRRNYVLYEHETPVLVPQPGRARWPQRPVGQRTVFTSDTSCGGTPCHTQSLSSGYDNHGNYRQTVTSSNFGPARTETTDYNPSRVIQAHEPWILNLYTRQTVTETAASDIAPATRVTQVCIDAATGALRGRRTQKEVTAGNTDVIVRYTYDVHGNPEYERWYGGDHSPLQSGNLCTTDGAGNSEYRIKRTFEAGMLMTAQYRDMPALDADYTIDTNTGLAKASRDSAGVETAYEYDRLSRLTTVIPPFGHDITYRYTPATATARAAVLMQRGGDNDIGVKRETTFDGLGRVHREGERLPANWSYRYTTYDQAGRVHTRTELGVLPEAQLPKTTYTYDAFDRIATTLLPDGAILKEAYPGHGVRIKERSSFVKLPAGPAEVKVTERYDSFGRLVEVREPSGATTPSSASGSSVTTQYAYDPGDRLRLVTMQGDGSAQIRVFDYDGRGFLRWEMQPESGVAAYSYDSRSNVKSRSLGAAASPYDLQYTYDGAGRLIEVAGRNPLYRAGSTYWAEQREFRPLKSFEFAATKATGLEGIPEDYGLGKLRSATRYNYPPLTHTMLPTDIVKVVERYYYIDPDGVRTSRATAVWTVSYFGFEQHRRTMWHEEFRDVYGQVDSHTYPHAIATGDGPRTVRYAWQYGRLTAVNGSAGVTPFVRAITYHPNGMRKELLHGNDMTDTQWLDPTGMPRPSRLQTGPSAKLCLAPQIIDHPVGKKVGPNDPDPVLSVLATGTAVLRYQWIDGTTGQELTGQTSATFTAPRQNGLYRVRVSNDCKFADSTTAHITLDSCPTPDVTATREINKDGTVTLRARANGAGTFTYQWFRVSDGTLILTGREITVTAAIGLQQVRVDVTSDCENKVGTATLPKETQVTVVTGLRASVSANRQSIVVDWPAVPGVQSYTLARRTAGGVDTFHTVNGTQFIDTDLSFSTAYAYALAGEIVSNADVATTFPLTPILSGVTPVSLTYFNELLQALNGIRSISNWPQLTWQTIMPPSVPVPAAGGTVYAFYFSALRPRMNEALQALGATVTPYTDPDPRLVVIRAQHMTELQRRAQ